MSKENYRDAIRPPKMCALKTTQSRSSNQPYPRYERRILLKRYFSRESSSLLISGERSRWFFLSRHALWSEVGQVTKLSRFFFSIDFSSRLFLTNLQRLHLNSDHCKPCSRSFTAICSRCQSLFTGDLLLLSCFMADLLQLSLFLSIGTPFLS
jgi:hypothetical protein